MGTHLESLKSNLQKTETKNQKKSDHGVCQGRQPERLCRGLCRLSQKIGQDLSPQMGRLCQDSDPEAARSSDDDWFYIRTASIARQLYIKGTVGVGRFAVIYGGTVNRG